MEKDYNSILERKAVQIKAYNRGNEMYANHQKHVIEEILKTFSAEQLDEAYDFFADKEKYYNSIIRVELKWETKDTLQKTREMYDLFVKKFASICLKKEIKTLKEDLEKSDI